MTTVVSISEAMVWRRMAASFYEEDTAGGRRGLGNSGWGGRAGQLPSLRLRRVRLDGQPGEDGGAVPLLGHGIAILLSPVQPLLLPRIVRRLEHQEVIVGDLAA